MLFLAGIGSSLHSLYILLCCLSLSLSPSDSRFNFPRLLLPLLIFYPVFTPSPSLFPLCIQPVIGLMLFIHPAFHSLSAYYSSYRIYTSGFSFLFQIKERPSFVECFQLYCHFFRLCNKIQQAILKKYNV